MFCTVLLCSTAFAATHRRLRLGAEDIASLPHSQACAVCLESFEPGEEARCV